MKEKLEKALKIINKFGLVIGLLFIGVVFLAIQDITRLEQKVNDLTNIVKDLTVNVETLKH